MINSDSGSNVPQNDTPEKAEHNSGSDSSEKDEPEDTEEIDPEESKYNEALECIENGKHAEAYQAFTELGDYKDSKTIMKSLPGYILVNWLKAEGDQEFKSNNPEYSVRLSAEGDDAFCMEYHFYSKDQYSSVVSTDLSLLVTAGEKYAEVSDEGCLSFIGGQGLIADTGSGEKSHCLCFTVCLHLYA